MTLLISILYLIQLPCGMEAFNRRGEAIKAGVTDRIEALVEALQLKFQEIEHKREEYRKEFKELDKRRMESTRQYSTQVRPSDWVKLNVGGTHMMSFRRSTLTSVEGSMLEAVFSGRWEKRLTRDRQGRIFIDEDPVVFGEVIRYLQMLEVRK